MKLAFPVGLAFPVDGKGPDLRMGMEGFQIF